MNKRFTYISTAAAVFLLAASLFSCTSKEKPDSVQVNASAGVERAEDARKADTPDAENPNSSLDGYTEPPLSKDDGKTSWSLKNGKYTFSFAPRDEDGAKDFSDISSLYGVDLPDQPDDWYCGKSTYDETTGEVTVTWDRDAGTLETLEKYGGIYRGDTTKKVCYFTFDCGYEFGPTASILDTLKEKEVSATFFVTGDYVKTEHDLMARMLDEGHVLGNHTVSHAHCTDLSAAELKEEVDGLEEMLLSQFPDMEPMVFFRPPYGNCNEYVLAVMHKLGYYSVMWSYTYMDYDTNNQLSYSDAMAKVKSGLHPGCVYLFHTESTTNAAILGDFIDWVRAQGYEILPLADIIAEKD